MGVKPIRPINRTEASCILHLPDCRGVSHRRASGANEAQNAIQYSESPIMALRTIMNCMIGYVKSVIKTSAPGLQSAIVWYASTTNAYTSSEYVRIFITNIDRLPIW